MTIRTDINVDFELSPRLAEIDAAGSDEVTAQDSHDTLATIEDGTSEGAQHPGLVSTAGKEPLGGGSLVGLTQTLQDVQYAAAATSPRSTGTATSTDGAGVTLTDTSADFLGDGVVRGDWVINFTDQSVTEVLTVTTQAIVTRGLRNGTANTFTSGDAYKVWEVAEFALTGGNILAVDDMDAELNPIFTTFGRFATRISSSSATLQDEAIVALQRRFGLEEGNPTTESPTRISTVDLKLDVVVSGGQNSAIDYGDSVTKVFTRQ